MTETHEEKKLINTFWAQNITICCLLVTIALVIGRMTLTSPVYEKCLTTKTNCWISNESFENKDNIPTYIIIDDNGTLVLEYIPETIMKTAISPFHNLTCRYVYDDKPTVAIGKMGVKDCYWDGINKPNLKNPCFHYLDIFIFNSILLSIIFISISWIIALDITFC